MKIDNLLREMIEEELKEAGAVGDNMTLNMIHGVLNTILAKYGGNYETASRSPEWQVALKNGEAARQSSTQTGPSQQKQFSAQQKASNDMLSRIRAKLATRQSVAPQGKNTKDRMVAALAKTQKMPESKLVETIKSLVREALKEAKKNG